MTIKIALGCVIYFLSYALALADDTIQLQLKRFLDSTLSISADFKQIVYDNQGKPNQIQSGKFYLKRPGQFRWQYQQPYLQEIVSDGAKVWFYDADLEQVTIKPIDDSLGSTPALLLSGQVQLEESFNLEPQDSKKDHEQQWIKLIPKDESSGFKYILIGLLKGQLSSMELNDNFGQLTQIEFSQLQLNAPLPTDLFQFSIPEGVDVFSQ